MWGIKESEGQRLKNKARKYDEIHRQFSQKNGDFLLKLSPSDIIIFILTIEFYSKIWYNIFDLDIFI